MLRLLIDIANILRQSDKPIFLAVNKVDSHNQITMISDFYSLAVGDPIAISALHGSGGVGDLGMREGMLLFVF